MTKKATGTHCSQDVGHEIGVLSVKCVVLFRMRFGFKCRDDYESVNTVDVMAGLARLLV